MTDDRQQCTTCPQPYEQLLIGWVTGGTATTMKMANANAHAHAYNSKHPQTARFRCMAQMMTVVSPAVCFFLFSFLFLSIN
jgi:hypothetical protein